MKTSERVASAVKSASNSYAFPYWEADWKATPGMTKRELWAGQMMAAIMQVGLDKSFGGSVPKPFNAWADAAVRAAEALERRLTEGTA